MSDTPRTDAVNNYLRTRRDYTKTDHEVWMKHGIELESELAAAKERIRRLEEAGNAMHHEMQFGEWRDGLSRKLSNAARRAWLAEMEAKP